MPDWRPELRRRLAGIPLEAAGAEDVVEELAQHLEDRHRELIAGGAPAADAEALVLEELADAAALREALGRRGRPGPPATDLGEPSAGGWLVGLWSDVRYGLRALGKSRGTTAVALLTLALGIGANAALFSVVNAVLLRPLPFVEPDRLVSFWGTAPEKGLPVVNYPDALYAYLRSRLHALDAIAAASSGSVALTGTGDPEQLNGTWVTAGFFPLLGKAPLLGRSFLPGEDKAGASPVAILSHGLWQRRFGGDPGILGRSLTLGGAPTTVVGVMPPGFDFPNRSAFWMPLPIDPPSLNCWCYSMFGRLAPGSRAKDAVREVARLNADFWRERKPGAPPAAEDQTVDESGVVMVPLSRELAGPVRAPLLVLLGAVSLVLLIACLNVANLLLARANARVREIAVRCCLGASPWRIVRQLLVESLLLAVAGAAIGLALAFLGTRLLGRVATERVSHVQEIGLDGTVLVFTLGITLVTALLFGLAPALRAARVDLQGAVKDGVRGSRARGRRLNDAFVVLQLAFSLVLLVGAGLLLRSFWKLTAVDLGFRPESVLVGRVTLSTPAYGEPARVRAFYGQLAERVRALPGVVRVATSSSAPFSVGNNQENFLARGHEPGPDEPVLVASVRSVSAGYFAAMGTPLLRGREFEENDSGEAPRVAVVDESLARLYWPDGDAVGHEVRLGDRDSTNPWLSVVGVVASVKHGRPEEKPDRYIYVPHAQEPAVRMDLVVRTVADPGTQAGAIRREVQALDPAVPLYEVHTLEDAVARSLSTRRLTDLLLVVFALAALTLAALGIYGVMAVSVGQRVNEFGIRLALGATPGDVRSLVLGEGVRLVAVGVGIGLVGAVGLARLLGSLLFGVQPLDPLTYAGVTLALAAVALAACHLPARRATATDPLVALRCE